MAVHHSSQGETYRVRPRRRWGRRVLVTLLVLLAVCAAVLVVVDRVAVAVAERVIADQVRREMTKQEISSASPEVAVGGFPFLTQVLGGRYESVSIVLRDVQGPAEGRTVRVPELAVRVHGIAASIRTLRSGQGRIVAESVEGAATVSYGTVATFIDKEGLSLFEQDGRLAVTAPLDVLGQRVTVRGTAELTVEGNEVAIGFAELTADGLPANPTAQALVSAYARQISVRMPLPELPYGLEIRQVRAAPEGLSVTVSARNVLLNPVI